MFKNQDLLVKLEKRMVQYFYSKNPPKGVFMARELKPWLFSRSDAEYQSLVLGKFKSAKPTRTEMIQAINSTTDDFNGTEEMYQNKMQKVFFDYAIYSIHNEASKEVLAMYLIHENPLSKSQINNVKSKLGMSLREIDDNICELT